MNYGTSSPHVAILCFVTAMNVEKGLHLILGIDFWHLSMCFDNQQLQSGELRFHSTAFDAAGGV